MNVGRGIWKLGTVLLLLAWLAVRWTTGPLESSPVEIATAAGHPCQGTIWKSEGAPKAVILIGHGVTCNQGVMASIAKAFAHEGYLAVTFDFWGHGRSRERFAWKENPDQVRAWCAWARNTYPGMPLAYLGHSMGGFAGAEAFAEAPLVDAFVSMGALPPRFSEVKTLVAAGYFEELFTPEEAQRRAAGKAEVVISPYSNHMLEAWDPVLIRDMVYWVDGTLGLPGDTSIAWGRWLGELLDLLVGGTVAFLITGGVIGVLRGPAAPLDPLAPGRPRRLWAVNPYRVAGRILGVHGGGQPPRATSWKRSALLGAGYGVLLVLCMAVVLDRDAFTSAPVHPKRLLIWLLCSGALWPVFWLNERALEQLHYRHVWQRFGVAALTRAIPLALISLSVRLIAPDLAFGAMIVGILAFVATLIALIYALATQAAADSRAGAIAASVYLAWVIAFWFPLTW